MDRSQSVDQLLRVITNDPFEKVGRNTHRFVSGIVGGDRPSGFSRSPWLWNRLFEELELDAIFTAFDLPADRPFGDFASAIAAVPGLLDLTVTSPYKPVAYQHLADFGFETTASDRSKELGCLNHLMIKPGTKEARADFTDGWGLIRGIKKRRGLSGATALLIGAGGAGTAIGYELVCEGAALSIANIVEEDAEALVTRLSKVAARTGPEPRHIPWDQRAALSREMDIVISAVSVTSPLTADDIKATDAECLFAETRYGHRAEFADTVRGAGRECIDGREMLFGQFALAAYTVGELLELPESDVHTAVDRVDEWFMAQ